MLPAISLASTNGLLPVVDFRKTKALPISISTMRLIPYQVFPVFIAWQLISLVSAARAETPGPIAVAGPSVELVGLVAIPGAQFDKSGLEGKLETGSPANALGGFSAIDYCSESDEYYVLSDRGPADGAASFACRFHCITFRPKLDTSDVSKVEWDWNLKSTQLLRTSTEQPFTGSLAALQAWDGVGDCPSLDPEGLRLVNDLVLISDEYGPSIRFFDRSGRLKSEVAISSKFGLSERKTPAMKEGTFSNRGIEGICQTPKGGALVAVFQGPLVQDGRIVKKKCLGVQSRWLVIQRDLKTMSELNYVLDDESTGVSEVLAIDETRFLVLERDSESGVDAKVKRIYLADLAEASDISHLDSIAQGIPTDLKPIRKELLIDLMSPSYGLNGEKTPEKPEGLAWGPSMADGRRLLVVCFDNDFEEARQSILAAFAIQGL